MALHEYRIGRLEDAVEQINSRLDSLTERTSRVEGILEQQTERLGSIESRLNMLTFALIGAFATTIVAVVGTGAAIIGVILST